MHNSKKRNLPEFLSSLESINESEGRGEISKEEGLSSKIKLVTAPETKRMKPNDILAEEEADINASVSLTVQSHPAF